MFDSSEIHLLFGQPVDGVLTFHRVSEDGRVLQSPDPPVLEKEIGLIAVVLVLHPGGVTIQPGIQPAGQIVVVPDGGVIADADATAVDHHGFGHDDSAVGNFIEFAGYNMRGGINIPGSSPLFPGSFIHSLRQAVARPQKGRSCRQAGHAGAEIGADRLILIHPGDEGIVVARTTPGEELKILPLRTPVRNLRSVRNPVGIVVEIEEQRRSHLFQIAGTLDGSGPIPRLVQRRQQHRRQNCDDRYFIDLRKYFFYVCLCQWRIGKGLMIPIDTMYNNIG